MKGPAAAWSAQLDPRDLAWVIGSLANLHRATFDAGAWSRCTPAPHTLATLVDGLAEAGFAADVLRDASAATLARAALPAIVLVDERAAGIPPLADTAGVGGDLRPALVVRSGTDRVVWFPAGRRGAVETVMSDFIAAIAPVVVTAQPPSPDFVGADDGAVAAPRFGFATVLAELLRHRPVLRDVLVASFALQMIALALPLASQVIIDKVIVNRATSTLAVLGCALAILIVFSALLGWLRLWLLNHTGNRVDAVLGSAVYAHLLRLPIGFFERRAVGVLAARLNGIETIREFLSGAAITVILDVPFALVFVVAMAFYSVPLTLATLAMVALLALLSAACARPLERRLNEQFLAGARTQALATEAIGTIETVKALELERPFARRYDDALANWLRAGFATRQLANGYQSTAQALEQALAAIILCGGAWLVMQGGDFSIGMLVAFQMFASRVSQPVLRLAGLWQQFQQAQIAVRRLADIVDVPVEPRSGAGPVARSSAPVRFAGAGFRYGDGTWLFRGLDLEVAAGSLVVVTGSSGSGKSTLVRLLAGFAYPTEGRVEVAGRDTRTLALDTLRGSLGVVPQDTVLFAGTIADNLRHGQPHASMAQLEQACRDAGVHDAIVALPEGYGTTLGERGTGLSGGQRQRIALARALLREPAILLLDEPFSQLDAPAAKRAAATIAALKRRMTIVVVSHVLPAALAPDRIVRLDGQARNAADVTGAAGAA